MKVQPRQYSYPDAIYKALPFFYVSAGLLTMLLLSSWIAVLSGLILVSAGGVVWSMRYQYRRAPIQSTGQIEMPTLPAKESPVHKLLEISWKDTFQCGHPLIDAQHRRLFGICNDLINAVVSDESKFDIDMRLSELLDHIGNHFCTEEAVMAQAQYPLTAEHHERHVALLSRTKSMREQYLNDEVVAGELLGFIAYDVIVSHILREDVKWATPREH